MEKVSVNFYPFAGYAEEKTSGKGNKYVSISFCRKGKDAQGNKKSEYINIINPSDLLVMAKACEELYLMVMCAKKKDFEDKNEKLGCVNDVSSGIHDDDIPF